MLPCLVQIEVHPRYPQRSLRKLCSDNDIAVVAYSSLGVGDLVKHPVVCQIAQESQHTSAQVTAHGTENFSVNREGCKCYCVHHLRCSVAPY